jgi:hypothetical protein
MSAGTIKSHNGFSGREEKEIATRAREKVNRVISLALVEFEAKR